MHGVRLVSTPPTNSRPSARAGLSERCAVIPEKSTEEEATYEGNALHHAHGDSCRTRRGPARPRRRRARDEPTSRFHRKASYGDDTAAEGHEGGFPEGHD